MELGVEVFEVLVHLDEVNHHVGEGVEEVFLGEAGFAEEFSHGKIR